jgi:hypothetical protein
MCAPAIAAAAIFVAAILLNLSRGNYRSIPGHALLGVFAVLIIFFLCQRDAHTVAWILIAAPFGLVLLGYVLRVTFQYTVPTPVAPSTIMPGCPCCMSRPCHCLRPCSIPKPQPCPMPTPNPEPTPCPTPSPRPQPIPPSPCPSDNCIKPTLAT